MSDTVSKCHPFSFVFNLGNKAKSQGAKSSEYGGWGTITMLLLVTNYVVFRDACRRVVVMKEPVVVVPKFWSFFFPHIFYPTSQNITVKVDHSVRRNNFTVNNPLHATHTHKEHALC
jgi:hypothetical protein